MGRLLKILIKNCSYCDEDFGCTIDGVEQTCDTCGIEYNSAECSVNSMFTEVSHGICTEQCFLTRIQALNPQIAQRYEEFANT